MPRAIRRQGELQAGDLRLETAGNCGGHVGQTSCVRHSHRPSASPQDKQRRRGRRERRRHPKPSHHEVHEDHEEQRFGLPDPLRAQGTATLADPTTSSRPARVLCSVGVSAYGETLALKTALRRSEVETNLELARKPRGPFDSAPLDRARGREAKQAVGSVTTSHHGDQSTPPSRLRTPLRRATGLRSPGGERRSGVRLRARGRRRGSSTSLDFQQ
jgi:hypothetical protein